MHPMGEFPDTADEHFSVTDGSFPREGPDRWGIGEKKRAPVDLGDG